MKYLKKIFEFNSQIILFKDEKRIKDYLLKNKDFANGDVHQGIVDIIYDKWQSENKWSYSNIIEWTKDNLGEMPLLCLYLGNYNGQVCNGGHMQYFDNGYASSEHKGAFADYDDIEEHDEFEELFKKLGLIESIPTGKQAYDVIHSFELYMEDEECSDCGGEGTTECYECEGEGTITCPDCNGDGEDEEGETCSECDGDGVVTCDECNGDGSVDCDYCRGTGYDDRHQKPSTYEWENLDTKWYKINDKFMEQFNDYLKTLTLDGDKISDLISLANETQKYKL